MVLVILLFLYLGEQKQAFINSLTGGIATPAVAAPSTAPPGAGTAPPAPAAQAPVARTSQTTR